MEKAIERSLESLVSVVENSTENCSPMTPRHIYNAMTLISHHRENENILTSVARGFESRISDSTFDFSDGCYRVIRKK